MAHLAPQNGKCIELLNVMYKKFRMDIINMETSTQV